MSISWEKTCPSALLYDVEDVSVEDFRLRFMCERRFQA